MASETTPILQRRDYDAQDLPASISSASVHKELSAGKIAAVAFTLFTMLFLIVLFAHHNRGLAAPEAGKWTFNGASYEGTFSSRRVFHPKSHKGYSEIDDRLCDPNVESEAGYYRINGLGEKNYFYWFFESRRSPRDDPVVIWLTGGPGCSSQMALFAENGPCTVNPDARDTTNNPYSWTDRANVIWIDQPADVGFSYNTKDPEHKYLDKDEDEVAEDMYHFLLAWFKGHPQFHRNQFYIFGESYAGHYIPAVSHRVYEGNRKLEGAHINLVGLGIGNGMTNPAVQFKHYADFAFNNTHRRIISQATYDRMKVMEGGCTALIEACQLDKLKCAAAYIFCTEHFLKPVLASGTNPYDVRIPCEMSALPCYNFTQIGTFLDRPDVRRKLNVPGSVGAWKECNRDVTVKFMLVDYMTAFHRKLPVLLQHGIRVLVYAGDADFICNWMGNFAWTLQLEWAGRSGYNAAPDMPWVVDGKRAGTVRTASGLTFLRVFSAGHMVPMDQPGNSLALLNTFLADQPFY